MPRKKAQKTAPELLNEFLVKNNISLTRPPVVIKASELKELANSVAVFPQLNSILIDPSPVGAKYNEQE